MTVRFPEDLSSSITASGISAVTIESINAVTCFLNSGL